MINKEKPETFALILDAVTKYKINRFNIYSVAFHNPQYVDL